MKPTPYNRKKRFLIELSRSQLFLSIAGALFVVSWIFILGIFVGRGYVSDTISRTFTAKIQKLQEEKKALMDKYLVQEKKDTIPQEEILNPPLEFFNKPSQRDTVITQAVPRPSPRPLSPVTKGPLSIKPSSLETKTESRVPPIETKAAKTPVMETKVAKGSQENLAKPSPFIVQIGSYREEPTAQSFLKRLSEKGYQAQLRMKDIPEKGGKWYRVQIGPFQSRLEAEKALIRLEHDGFRAVVLDKNY